MNMNQIHCFVRVAQTGSFSKAAVQEHLTQSAVTKQIQSLENEFGLMLFQRGRRGAALSEAGERLLPLAQELLACGSRLLLETEALRLEERQAVRLCSLPVLGQYGLVQRMADYEREYPGCPILSEDCEEEELLQRLEQNRCDLAILRREILPGAGAECLPLAEDRLALLVRRDHPLAGSTCAAWAQLQGEHLLLMPRHTWVSQLCEALCREHGLEKSIVRHARLETIFSTVESGRGCALLMEKSLRVFRGEALCMIPLEPAVTSRLVLVFSPAGRRNPAARRLARFLTGTGRP